MVDFKVTTKNKVIKEKQSEEPIKVDRRRYKLGQRTEKNNQEKY